MDGTTWHLGYLWLLGPRTWVTPEEGDVCIQRCLRGLWQGSPWSPALPRWLPWQSLPVWWGHLQEGSHCHSSRCSLPLAQGCAHDVSRDCDITGWRRSEKGVPGASARGPGPGPDKMVDPQENAAGKPPELEGRLGVTGGVGWEGWG